MTRCFCFMFGRRDIWFTLYYVFSSTLQQTKNSFGALSKNSWRTTKYQRQNTLSQHQAICTCTAWEAGPDFHLAVTIEPQWVFSILGLTCNKSYIPLTPFKWAESNQVKCPHLAVFILLSVGTNSLNIW